MRLSVRSTIYAGILVGLLACSHLFVTAGAESFRAAFVGRIESKQRALAELRRSTPSVSDAKSRLAGLGQVVARFDSGRFDRLTAGLSPSTEMDEIIREVRQMAESNSLQTRAIQPLRGESTTNYTCQPIELSVSGDFNGFYAFLLQLERLPWLTQVTQMQLERSPDHDGEMQAKLVLSVFFLTGSDGINRFRTALCATQNLAADPLINPAKMQIPLAALHINPFRQGSADTRPPEAALRAARVREDQERAAMLTAIGALRLQSVIRGAARRSCMINNTLYVEGELVGGFTVEQINSQSVVIRNGMYRFELRGEP